MAKKETKWRIVSAVNNKRQCRLIVGVNAKNLARRDSGEEWTAGEWVPIDNRRNGKKRTLRPTDGNFKKKGKIERGKIKEIKG